MQAGGMAEAASSQAEAARSAYIHIPFCQQRCFYCDFPIKVVGSSPQDGRARDTIEEYLESLLEEIRRGGGGGFDVEVAAAPLRTVYLGGGTPSLLRPEQVRAVLDAPPPLPPVLTGHVSSLLPY
jgi:coproporphyrinogen III oxidase-like Fe-S oxidoreductase